MVSPLSEFMDVEIGTVDQLGVEVAESIAEKVEDVLVGVHKEVKIQITHLEQIRLHLQQPFIQREHQCFVP